MSIFLPHCFEELKNCVLNISGLKNVTPGDCKSISLLILHKTKQRVSETTIKRVYGFAYSQFKPSSFTMEVMSQFCGYPSWADFCTSLEKRNVDKANYIPEWETLKHNAGKITNFTLQALKNRSGIPYNQTITRKFIDDHFEAFLNEDYTATVIAAPAGYGKTIALCHWIDNRLELNALNKTNDIILLFSSSALINVFLSGRDINEWLLSLLGYSPEDDISVLLKNRAGNNDCFFLVIDGFDDHMFKSEQFKMVLSQLIDVLALYRGHACFKLILTMRLASWINYRHELDNGEHTWFMGFPQNGHPIINVPLFNSDEISRLSAKINPALTPTAQACESAAKFSHPLYFQFYYKDHKENFSLDHIDHVCIYDLISTFILNKVYLGHNSADKILLLKEMVDRMEIPSKHYAVNKVDVNHLLKQYSVAYTDLINIGFLREQNRSSGMGDNIYIEFSNNDFLEYSIAKKLLHDNGYAFNASLIRKINVLYRDNSMKLPVLKWSILYALKSEQEGELDTLAGAELSISEKADLVVFLAELFEKECFPVPHSESVKNYVKEECLKQLFNYFIGIEFIDPDYEKTLHILLKFELTNLQKITIYSSLAIIDIIRLDLNKLDNRLQKLRQFSSVDYAAFPINPLNCFDAVYYYLKYGITKQEFLTDVTRFSFNPPPANSLEDTAANDIIFTLAIYASAIARPQKGLRLVNALKHYYKNGDASTGYGFFLNVVEADRRFLLGDIDGAMAIYHNVAALYDHHESSYTVIMRALFATLKLKVSLFNSNYNDMVQQIKHIADFVEKTGYALPAVYIYAFLLKHAHLLSAYPKLEKQVAYDLKKVLRKHDIPAEIFLGPGDKVVVVRK